MNLWSQKLIRTYYQCLNSTITAHFNHWVLLTSALKTKTRIMTLWALTQSKSNPNLVQTPVPYRLPMGSWSGIGTFTRTPSLSLSPSTWSLRILYDSRIYFPGSVVALFPFPFAFSCSCGPWIASAIFHTRSQERSLFVLPAPGKPGLNPGVLRTGVPNNVLIMS